MKIVCIFLSWKASLRLYINVSLYTRWERILLAFLCQVFYQTRTCISAVVCRTASWSPLWIIYCLTEWVLSTFLTIAEIYFSDMSRWDYLNEQILREGEEKLKISQWQRSKTIWYKWTDAWMKKSPSKPMDLRHCYYLTFIPVFNSHALFFTVSIHSEIIL